MHSILYPIIAFCVCVCVQFLFHSHMLAQRALYVRACLRSYVCVFARATQSLNKTSNDFFS